MADIARVLRAALPGATAKRVPSRTLPNWLVRISPVVDATVRSRLFELGKQRAVSSEKARRVLGWSPRSNDEAVIATAESLIAHGLVPG